jgi:hypothetical protein
MFEYSTLDIAISNRLAPLRGSLVSDLVPVAAVSKTANEIPTNQLEFVSWVFTGYRGAEMQQASLTTQSIVMELLVTLKFGSRYDETPDDETDRIAALEWVEEQILKLLCNWRLPGSLTNLAIVDGRLYIPEGGRWQKDIRFEFEVPIESQESLDAMEPPYYVTRIIAMEENSSRELFNVSG